MITQQTLMIATLIISIISMLMSMIALWPQWREQFAVLRDFVLWGALVVVAAIVLNVGWNRAPRSTAIPNKVVHSSLNYAIVPAADSKLQPVIHMPHRYRGSDFLAPIQR